MSVVAQVAIDFALTSCASCGINFQLPYWFDQKLREKGASFFCPNGHSLSYGRGEVERLRSELAAEQSKRQSADSRATMAENTSRVLRGHLTRVRRRVAGGVCPCCNRTFVKLGQHMKTKHPDFGESRA